MTFARKRFGQHFLHDRGVLDRILREIAPASGDALVEIGPGRGALTEKLVAHMDAGQGRSLDVVEIDRDLAAELRARWGADPRFQLHEGDALEYDFASLSTARGQRLRVIGNLPYNISTPLLFHLAAAHEYIDDLHVMLQKEVIDRIAAAPGSESYGRLDGDAGALVRSQTPVRRRPRRVHAAAARSGPRWRGSRCAGSRHSPCPRPSPARYRRRSRIVARLCAMPCARFWISRTSWLSASIPASARRC